MPNTIKYSTGPVTRALRVGNFYLGVGDEGKGPTNETGFWNGFSTGTFSYIIYQNKQDNGPIIYPIQNDTELIERTNYIDSSIVRTTKEECFEYFASQSDKMVVNKDYEAIVTDGLLLNLDAGFLPSYPGTGSSWSDTSLNSYNWSLVNSPSFVSDYFSFDGINQYVTITNLGLYLPPTTNRTLEIWARINSYPVTQGGLLAGQKNTTGALMVLSNGKFSWYWDDSVAVQSSTTLSIGRWFHIIVLLRNSYYCTYYVNGALDTSEFITSDTGAGQVTTWSIGRQNRDFSGDFYYLNCDVSVVRQYNKLLSAQEVLQNYYQGPIVTDGLVFSFDSSNIISYPFTGTTAYSLTGSNTLTLANGVGFDKKYGGRWTFDGSNDRLDSNFTDVIDSVTIECWYRGTKTTRNHLWNFGLAPTTNFHCNFNDSGIPLWFYWNGNGSPRLWFTQGNFTDGTIKQLVFTHQGSDNQAYLNGQLLTAGRATSGTQTFNNVNSGGTFNLGGNPSFGGDIYQVRIYNRALSASEIFQNFNAHRSRYGI